MRTCALFLLACAASLIAQQPIAAIGTAYRQNFDSLANSATASSLPTGWALLETGTNANATYTAADGAGNSGDTYSFGASGSTDRAFGGLQSGSLIPVIGAAFVNNTGRTIRSLVIEYRGEQWRLGTSGRGPDRLDFQYSLNATDFATASGAWVDVDGLDFASPLTTGAVGAVDGNTNTSTVTFTIGGLEIADGQRFRIRWTDFNASGADDGLAIDDFNLTASEDPGEVITATPATISEIQGPGAVSPLNGKRVVTQGIVTALINNGFFLQTPDGETDGLFETSEGLFVFTVSAPTVAVGDAVRVTGEVTEFVPAADPRSPSITEIISPAVEVLTSGNPLPASIEVTGDLLKSSGGISQLEPLEGMRVSVSRLQVIAPTGGSVNETTGASTSNGVFWGVLPGADVPFREPGIDVSDPVPACAAGSNCAIPVYDSNPERIRVDSDLARGQVALNLAAGETVTGLEGVLHYGFRAYTVVPTRTPSVIALPRPLEAQPVAPAPTGAIAVASMNVQRLFDTVNDPAIGEPVPTLAAYQGKLRKLVRTIREILRSPDVIALQEVENEATAQALATQLNEEAWKNGENSPEYVAALAEGNDPGGIDVALLVKTTTIRIVSIDQFGFDATYQSPCGTQQLEVLNDRPPLRLRAIAEKGGAKLDFSLFVNHLRSLTGVDDNTACGNGRTEADRVRLKRLLQADFAARMLARELGENPSAKILAVGDFNAFEVNDGYVDVLNTIAGNPAPLNQVTTGLALASRPSYQPMTNLLSILQPASERYSYIFDGVRQTLDHVLLNPAAANYLAGGGYARVNSGFPESLRGDFTRPERFSDHDPVVVYLSLTAR